MKECMRLRASVRVRPTVQEFDLFLNCFKGRTNIFDLCSATPMTPRQPGAWIKYSPLSYSLNEYVFLHEFVWVRRRILFTTTRAKRAQILFGPLPSMPFPVAAVRSVPSSDRQTSHPPMAV